MFLLNSLCITVYFLLVEYAPLVLLTRANKRSNIVSIESDNPMGL